LKYEEQGQQTFNYQQGDNNSFQATVEDSVVLYLKEEIQILRKEIGELRQLNLEMTKKLLSL
jgi:hypothetical protein